jgi:hypothetical protein
MRLLQPTRGIGRLSIEYLQVEARATLMESDYSTLTEM